MLDVYLTYRLRLRLLGAFLVLFFMPLRTGAFQILKILNVKTAFRCWDMDWNRLLTFGVRFWFCGGFGERMWMVIINKRLSINVKYELHSELRSQ